LIDHTVNTIAYVLYLSVSRNDAQSPTSSTPLSFPVYKSPQRTLALQLCGWYWDQKNRSLEDSILKLEKKVSVAIYHREKIAILIP
jgi:hypothetical protein